MKFLSKIIGSKILLIKVVLSVMIGALLSMIVSLFLPNENLLLTKIVDGESSSSFSVASAFSMESKKVVETKKVVVKQSSKEFKLREFAINGIFLDGENSMVIVKDRAGGIFVSVGAKHKGYTLDKVFLKKARFKKGIDFYWSFLDPEDEKNFKESEGSPSNDKAAVTKVRETVAQDMFETIVFKDGKYYIPKDMLLNKADMMRHLGSAGARIFNIDGVISFKIHYLPKRSVFYKLGIRQGDFIVGANGEGFKSAKDPVKFFQSIDSVKSLSLSIKRSNEDKELVYEVY